MGRSAASSPGGRRRAGGRTPAALRRPRLTPLLALGLLLGGGLAAPPAGALPDCQAAQRQATEQMRDLLAQAPRLQVLLLGEIHTSAADHAWQLRTLESLSARRPLSLGLEMVPAPRQAVLDRFAAGQLSEEAFLSQVGWAEVWGHDAELYLPLLRWARRNRVPLLALNAEPQLVRQVRRQGLAAATRLGIGTPAAAGPAYRQRLTASWRAHRPVAGPAAAPALSAADTDDLQRFIDSQLLRDRVMAEQLAAAQRRDRGRLVVGLIGRGHLEDGDGVPQQLRDLGLQRLLSLTRPPLPDGCAPPPPRARLGAYLESDAGGVWVRRVAPGSAAAAAGLREGDRILELNGSAVTHAGQVIRGVRLLPDGVPLQLLIERAGRRLRLELRLPASGEPRLASRENGSHLMSAATGRTGVASRHASLPRRPASPTRPALSPP